MPLVKMVVKCRECFVSSRVCVVYRSCGRARNLCAQHTQMSEVPISTVRAAYLVYSLFRPIISQIRTRFGPARSLAA